MSTEFAKTAKALAENPELLAQLCSTDSAEKRANMLSEAGLTVPTSANVNEHLATMAGVTGGLDASPTMPLSVGPESAAQVILAASVRPGMLG